MRMRTRAKAWTAAWLVLLFVLQVLAFLVLTRYAVGTRPGQWLDTVALTGNRIGQDRIDGPVDRVLNAMSVVSLLAVTAVIGFIALIRGRVALAIMATLLIGGANVTTQLLKYGLTRPDFGIDPERAAVGNSLPSGHTAVAASVAVALVLVLPRQVRAVGALVGTAYAGIAGVATLSAGWHRPSDAVAAFLVVGAWAALAGLVLLFTQREQAQVDPADAHRVVASVLGIGGLLLVTGCAVALARITDVGLPDPAGLARDTLFTAYAGSAAGIAGSMGVVMALVLTSVHRLVPRLKG
ncbi:phosphatase PAP2 family protein [Micromonospora sp. CPCC 206060]|uniref:phosphatase PAP2 family protein n=1 Tax=Micromonospora sp. CPCC 206060 TaxID=3122406 RepID=UPI002FF2039C